jgi:hypothetical protein
MKRSRCPKKIVTNITKTINISDLKTEIHNRVILVAKQHLYNNIDSSELPPISICDRFSCYDSILDMCRNLPKTMYDCFNNIVVDFLEQSIIPFIETHVRRTREELQNIINQFILVDDVSNIVLQYMMADFDFFVEPLNHCWKVYKFLSNELSVYFFNLNRFYLRKKVMGNLEGQFWWIWREKIASRYLPRNISTKFEFNDSICFPQRIPYLIPRQ